MESNKNLIQHQEIFSNHLLNPDKVLQINIFNIFQKRKRKLFRHSPQPEHMVELDPFFHQINSWSFTKHRVWNRCQRQYYFDYVAPYVKSKPVVDPNIIRRLRTFNSKFVLQGQIIHDIINDQIKLHCEDMPMDPEGAVNTYSKKIARFKDMASEVLTEYRNGEPTRDSFFTGIEGSGRDYLDIFFNRIWPDYKNRECLRHEEFDKFRINDIEVTVKVDFVGKQPDGTIILTDWKTGKDSDEYEIDLQMAAYVLWARDYYLKSVDDISAEIVFLKTGEKKQYAFFDEQLRERLDMIPREFASMNASYEYEDFPARPSQRECMSCRFAKVCPEAAVRK